MILVLAVLLAGVPTSFGASAAKFHYTSNLVEQQSGQEPVCAHMKEVFNRNFSDLWNTEPLWSENDPRYAADSRYAFPMAPGVTHEARKTFAMRFSKIPSSPEFDSIDWEEGRALIGVGKNPQSILIAHFDFDNDGIVDTVVKVGFNGGYDYVTFGGHLFEESLLVFRSRIITPQDVFNLDSLTRDVSAELQPVIANATYERPFRYQSHTYVARYDEDLGEGGDAGSRAPYRPLSETMNVLDYRLGCSEPITRAPAWDTETVCGFSMS